MTAKLLHIAKPHVRNKREVRIALCGRRVSVMACTDFPKATCPRCLDTARTLDPNEYGYSYMGPVPHAGMPAPMKFTIEFRPETRRQGGPFEVKRGEGHVRLCATASEAYRAVVTDPDARQPLYVEWINVPPHIQHEAMERR